MATLQQGTNEEYIQKKEDLEETRDYELTRLRLWEEYQVKRIETEYNEDLLKANHNHDKMIKLIKEKLYDKLERQIKQLKDDKLLLNLVNANSWKGINGNSGTSSSVLSAAEAAISLHERRSLRKRETSLRFTAGEADDLSDGGNNIGGDFGGRTSAGGGGGGGNGYFSSTFNGGGYSSSTKRRRHYATRYSSNDESSGVASNGTSRNGGHLNGGGLSSGNDSNLSDKDYDTLNTIIMGNEDGGVSLELLDKATNGNTSNTGNGLHKPNTRGSNKQFTGLSGLKPEELNDDLTLLRNAIKKDK